ncbi:MAG: CDP-alcohol phosphatidyltransferase family protein [bacterium]
MGIYSVKPKFQKILTPVKDLLVRGKVHPTTINIIGLAISLLAGIALYYSGQYALLLWYIPVAGFVRTACNALDGLVSRELGEASAFGEVLNEFIDRISDSAIFLGVTFSALADMRLGIVTLVVILLNSYLSIVSKAAGGSRQYGGIMGKADRMIYLGIAAVAVAVSGYTEIWNYFLVFILAGTMITMYQRFMVTRKELA